MSKSGKSKEPDDPFDDPGWLEYAEHVRTELIPMIDKSAITMALVSGAPPDPKQACELGYMVMLDKPIIAVVVPGCKVPKKLLLVADAIVEGDMNDPEMGRRLASEIDRVMKEKGLK